MNGRSPVIRQVYVHRTKDGPVVVAKSGSVTFGWEEVARRLAVRFGPRPPGVRCPAVVFALAHDEKWVIVGQVADLVPDWGDPPLGFRLLIFERGNYPGDPFDIAGRFPPDWSARGELPDIEWPAEWPPRRAADEIQHILKSGDGPLMLGTTQALLDGARVAVRRSAPDEGFVRGVWQLLPDSTRAERWPATFAFSNELGFDLAALPAAVAPGCLTEDQARDYPEGRYELALQIAAEAGDQAELDRLFARKSSRDVLRLAVGMVLFALAVAAVLKFL